jgi:hypothetical protein
MSFNAMQDTASAPSVPEVQPRAPTDHLYWARSSSQNAAPPPKPISQEQAKAMEARDKGGSAWNKGGATWEEKPINTWATALLKDQLLPELAYDLPLPGIVVPPLPPGEAGGSSVVVGVRVAEVNAVNGDCTYVVSRGKQRVVFELTLKLTLEMEVRVDSELKQILTGKMTLSDVANDDLDEAKMPSTVKCTCEQDEWRRFFEGCAKASWAGVTERLRALVEQAKQKWA